MIEITVTELAPHELDCAAAVLGRGYRDTPLSVAIYSDDVERRLRSVERVMGRRIAAMEPPPLVARREGVIVGVCGLATPGACQLSTSERERAAVPQGGASGSLVKLLEMAAEWDRHHPNEPHWHLGPVAVEPALQGNGIGGLMVERFCALVDADGGTAFLETDRPENVRFFERFGFVTAAEAEVIGVPNWFMRREPRAVIGG
jgi:ribosomal protein S18 acetylase RimI-like enzyme